MSRIKAIHLDMRIPTYLSSYIYRPPPSVKNKLTVDKFMNEFSTLLESASVLQNLLMVGDLNFHIDDAANKDAKSFLEVLDMADLHQHVDSPTHRGSHIRSCDLS